MLPLPELITVDCYDCAGDGAVETESGCYHVCESCNGGGLQDVCSVCMESPHGFTDECGCNQTALEKAA